MTQHTVKRNGNGKREVTLALVEKKIQKGDYENAPYLGFPDVTNENLQDVRDFLGDEAFFGFLNQPLNQLGIGAMKKAATFADQENEEGFKPITGVNWQKAISSIEDLSARGETKEDLLKRKDDVINEIIRLSSMVADDPSVAVQMLTLGKQKKEIDEQLTARSESWKRRLAGGKAVEVE